MLILSWAPKGLGFSTPPAQPPAATIASLLTILLHARSFCQQLYPLVLATQHPGVSKHLRLHHHHSFISSFKASSLRFWTFLTWPGLGGTLEEDFMTPKNLVSFIPTKPVPCGQHWCSRTVHPRWVLASLDHIYRPPCVWVVVFEQGTPSDIYFVQALFFQIHLPFNKLEPLVGRVVSLQNLFSCSSAE